MSNELCEDEGCPHYGTPHICVSGKAMSNRKAWLAYMLNVAQPVLENLAAGTLKKNMPVEAYPGELARRKNTTYLEAFARTLSGIAPWLQTPILYDAEEKKLQSYYRNLALDCLAVAFDSCAQDYMDTTVDRQSIVDMGFLALALLRAPYLLETASHSTKANLLDAFIGTRKHTPSNNNWLLCQALIEVMIGKLGGTYNRNMATNIAHHFVDNWYIGDGFYRDGDNFQFDYYNSIAIHPCLVAIANEGLLTPNRERLVYQRATRQAQVLERMIGADGSFPAIGRSLSYRCGVFHGLADVALHNPAFKLPANQVRCALFSVIQRTLGDTSFKDGWLRIGCYGAQETIGEGYISTGSLYMCMNAFLPLGLPEDNRFWTLPNMPWTSALALTNDFVAPDFSIDGLPFHLGKASSDPTI